MDIMGYADNASKIELERRRSEDEHMLSQNTLIEGRLKMAAQLQSMMDSQTERKAIQFYDPNDPNSLDRVSAMLAAGGDLPGVMSVQKMRSDMAYKNLETRAKATQANREELQSIGGIAKTMDTPGGYAAGITQIANMGVDPNKYGLPRDFGSGAFRAKQLAASSLSAAQQETISRQQQDADRRMRLEQDRYQVEQRRLDQMDKRDRIAEARVSLQMEGLNIQSKRMEQIQAGKEEDRALAQSRFAAVMQPKVVANAYAVLNADEQFDGLTDKQKQAYASIIANRAIKKVNTAIKDPNAVEGSAYSDAIDGAIQDLLKEGTIKPKKSFVDRMIGVIKGPGEPTKIKSDADYEALPSGTVFIGPDGKQRRKP